MMRNYLYLIFVFFSFVLFSQSKDDIQLRIVDSISNEPVSFATVRIYGTNQGVIADYDGELRLPSKLVQGDITLLITSIGYESQKVRVSDLRDNFINIIKLTVQIEALSTIYLKSKRVKSIKELEDAVEKLTATDIVRRAIDRIPIHLDDLAHSYVGYYRDYQIVKNTYYNLNEAILESYDQGISTKKLEHPNNQIALHHFETNSNFLIDSTFLVPYQYGEKFIENAKIPANGGNELSILNGHNPIRNYDIKAFSFVDVLKKDFLNHHDVTKGDLLYFDNVPIIKIPFVVDSTTKNEAYVAQGDLYISLVDYSIYRFNYICFETGNADPIFSINIEYKRQDDKMYLNYITFNNRFEMVDKNTLKEDEIIFYPESLEATITFNKPIDVKSLRKSSFKITYKGRKVVVESFKILNDLKVQVKILSLQVNDNEDLNYTELKGVKSEDLTFKLRGIKDLSGKRIYKRQDLQGYQFRELFVQEVFPNKTIPKDAVLSNRLRPLSEAELNIELDYNRYWINSPLKSTRTNN